MIFNRFQRPDALGMAAIAALVVTAGASRLAAADKPAGQPADILRSPETEAARSYKFAPADEILLEEIQRGCFNYLWNEVGQPAGLAKDRCLTALASTAGVGFQLSALPIGVERGWISREEGASRAESILRSLIERTDNKHDGVYLHFVNSTDGGQPPGDVVDQASTVDHALLLAGALPAAVYFGGEVARLADLMAADTNWRSYRNSPKDLISFGWRPADNRTMDGPGEYREWDWHIASDEEFLVYFLAVGAPREDYSVNPRDYYRLERTVKSHGDMPPYVVSWNGALFTYFFAHSWIDYGRFEADEPARFDVEAPRVDWFENSRRAMLTHRWRCIEAGGSFPTLAGDRWGLSPSSGRNADGRDSYLVPDVQPNLSNSDNFCGGTVAPYAAGSAIVFTPRESMDALRSMRHLRGKDGELLAWRDPAAGGFGFADSLNIEQQHASDDNIAIDVGPMIVAIENARTGLVWKLFMEHPVARRAVEKLGWELRADEQ
ncbi:MAG: hypothetical protein KF688_00650 [Pirellulales bacterium]|nr:hypothetical protein [Pirellulales bacterium]